MCSIHTIETPAAANLLDRLDELEHLAFGEPAGDLVEQQQRRLRGQCPGQLEALAIQQRQRSGDDVGLVAHARLLESRDRGVLFGAGELAATSERAAHQYVLERGQSLERAWDLCGATDAETATRSARAAW